MAALNIVNNILTLFNYHCNFAINMQTKRYHIFNQPSVPASKRPYFGLNTYPSVLSNDGKLYAIAQQKNLIIWETSTWRKVCNKTLERGASKIVFSPSDDSVIVADKTGDVYLFSVTSATPKGTLILGHLSILLDVLITPDEKFIITCDRDEKIRVSHYPNAYEIECFCLGHTEFVTKIALLNDVLLSCSGDGTIKFWSFQRGLELFSYNVLDDISVDENQCIITNLAVLHISNDVKILCLLVHKYDGILVYKYTKKDIIKIELIQKIFCKEPLDFALHNYLWILSCSDTSILEVWSWNGEQFQKLLNSETETILNVVNNKCSSLCNCIHTDFCVLYKKYSLNEQKRKKIRLE